ncbi:zinc-ribbon domain [Chthonomonas calidirosea]|uniref:zinc ribbon domain-containing protein n=1 Tax=Chthonomonas calidirosea TaxID=454171 RepID=UPI0006DD38E7|nr:zinc ribbon domain-containing protein [Chthonomonas calidirosea]CEK13541.1 zinc-ribbon domain [Chthonomonas calidirosea]CEK13543.1 zinc-ribbon domain [Chthonomonas calidirosea]
MRKRGYKARYAYEAHASQNEEPTEIASLIEGLQSLLAPDEHLLGYTRAWIAGGLKGKLNVCPEALFAALVNVGLTDKNLYIQHVNLANGEPSKLSPHHYPLTDVLHIQFADSETFGGTPAGRLTIQIADNLCLRLRVWGFFNVREARSLAKVFQAFTAQHRQEEPPLWHTCNACGEKLDQPYRFCPYCGRPSSPMIATDSTTPPSTENQESSPLN